ncbi:hypothetical protein TNCV_3379211 [Trichonephila clavipes]|nr:hypothetical protein TNCV_3379211 [Trichonephila clavipes]
MDNPFPCTYGGAVHTDVTSRQECPTKGHTGKYARRMLGTLSLRRRRKTFSFAVWKKLLDELKIFGMSSRHHIDDFMRGRSIGKIEEGRKITNVSREFHIAHSVVSRLWK